MIPERRERSEQLEQAGFTLLELIISMAIGLVIIAGIAMIFVSNSKTSSAVFSRTERMGDLYLASQLMQADLRESVANAAPNPAFPADLLAGKRKPTGICQAPNNQTVSLPANYPTSFPYYPYWDSASKTLTYQDLDGNTGIFQYQRTANDRVYWLRPDPCVYQFQELIRGLDPVNGMTLPVPPTQSGNVIEVKLQAGYQDENHQAKSLYLTFRTWPRNKR